MNRPSVLRFERDGGLARIILARPEAGNALDLDLCVALRDAAGRCATDATVKTVLLTAEGRAFCVGGDLVEFSAKGEDRPAHLLEVAETFHAAQARLMGLQAPVVVAVQGAAAGAGLGLALCGDLVLAAPEAQFTAAYTAIGLSADGGSTHFLPRLIGLRRTQELLLLNRRLSAAEALDWGLVTAVSPNLAVEAEALARRLANGPTAAFGTIKRLLGATYARTFADQTRDEGLGISELSGGRHAAEGLAAFFAKRPPMFDA